MDEPNHEIASQILQPSGEKIEIEPGTIIIFFFDKQNLAFKNQKKHIYFPKKTLIYHLVFYANTF